MRKKKPQDKGFVTGLKTEWNLFWETLLGEDENPNEREPGTELATGTEASPQAGAAAESKTGMKAESRTGMRAESKTKTGAQVGASSRDPFLTGKLETLNLEQIKAITKALSSDRKILNQKLEAISKQITECTAKLESLQLVGGESDSTKAKIHELNDLGQSLSEQLIRINERLKLARSREDAIKKPS